jgi:hypothetical protein
MSETKQDEKKPAAPKRYDANQRVERGLTLILPSHQVKEGQTAERQIELREVVSSERDAYMNWENKNIRYNAFGVPEPDNNYQDAQARVVHLVVYDVTDDPKGKRFPLEMIREWPGRVQSELYADCKGYLGSAAPAPPEDGGETTGEEGNASG